MEIIHEKSAPATKSEIIGLTSLPPTQEDIKSGHWEVIGPTQTLTGATVLEFAAGSGAYATDLAASFVELEFSISTTAGSVVTATACSFANNIAHSLWSRINLSINDTEVAAGHRYYAHSAMMMTLLGKNGSWADSGELEGFYKDTAGSMHDHAAANAGFVSRKELIKDAAVGDATPVVGDAFGRIWGRSNKQKSFQTGQG